MKKNAASPGSESSNTGIGSLVESVISVRRVTKVVKGGRRLTFASFVVVGDGNGRVAIASGKGKEASVAISKAVRKAKKSMIKVPMKGTTVPYSVNAKYGAGKVVLRSASQGTGVIAGGAMRLIIEAVGIKDVLAKSIGSSNPMTVARATMKALGQLRSIERIAELRGIVFAETAVASGE
jgi:small subunit ribosomal protein S5